MLTVTPDALSHFAVLLADREESDALRIAMAEESPGLPLDERRDNCVQLRLR